MKRFLADPDRALTWEYGAVDSSPRRHPQGVRLLPMSLRERLLILILAIGGFAATVNAVVLVPTLKPIASEFATTESIAGQIGTIYSLMSGLTALLVAQWIDRVSRRRLLRVGTIIISIGTLSTALAPSLPWLFVGRALTGLGGR